MADKLKIWKLGLKNGGIDFVALVDKPAIQENFLAFAAQKKYHFKATNSEKRIISGPLMISDLLIFRNDPDHGEHYVYFDAETIKDSVLNFFEKGLMSAVNLMHEDNLQPKDIFMFESFIIDSSKGINTPAGFETMPDGSWFGSYKVNNDKVWNDFIKTGEFKGFSIEGFFVYEEPDMSEEEELVLDMAKQLLEIFS